MKVKQCPRCRQFYNSGFRYNDDEIEIIKIGISYNSCIVETTDELCSSCVSILKSSHHSNLIMEG